MRKVLLATPIRGGASSSYFKSLMEVLRMPLPGIKLEHCVLEGPGVNFARNEIAHYALAIKADDLVFADEDMDFTAEHFGRLISHETVDVVAGLYCKRRPGQPFWLMNPKQGCEIDEKTGLCEVEDIAPGFMKIRTSVFRRIEKHFPDLEFYNKPEEGKPVTAFEYFPMGVWGPRTPRDRLAKIEEIIADIDREPAVYVGPGTVEPIRYLSAIESIEEVLNAKNEPGNLRGEDYGFCELARRCGIKIHADFGMAIIPHIGKIPFPILPDMVGLDPAAALAKAEAQKP